MECFRATLGGEKGERPLVELPFDPKAVYGTGRAPVRGTVNGADFRTTVAVYGGRSYLGFNAEVRGRAGMAIGDEVEVEVQLDTEPRTVEVPPELERVLAGADTARAAYEELSFTHRREYAEWVGSAKKQETRDRRASRAVEMLAEGTKHP